MDMTSIGVGAGGSIGVIALILLFKYLNTHKVKIISSCCSFVAEEDRTPQVTPQLPQIKPPT
jgi:hypothetical protein